MANKRKKFFTIMRIIGLFITGLIVAIIVALGQVNLETLRGNILSILQGATGTPVEIDGAVSWKFSLRPRIVLNQVRVPNADWAKCKNAVTADRIVVRLNLKSLFQSRPTIQNIRVNNVNICIEQDAHGHYSYETLAHDDQESKPADNKETKITPYPFEDPGLGGVVLKNVKAEILGNKYSLAGLNVRYMPQRETREYGGWIKVDKDVLPFIVSFAQYDSERRVYPVSVALSTGGDALIANVALDGASRAPIDFAIKGDLPDMDTLGRLLNYDLSDVPAMKLDIAGGLDGKKLTFRKSSVNLRDTDILFTGDIDWSRKIPSINADIDAKKIDLRQLAPELFGVDDTAPDRELNVFHDIPLFGSDLLKFNLKLRLDIDKFVVYRELAFRDFDVKANVNNGHVRLDINSRFADGNIRVVANSDIAADGTMDVTAGAHGDGISVGKILTQVRTNDFISDLPMTVKIYGRAQGRDLSELMQTFTGPVQAYSTASGYAHSELVSYMYGTDFLTSLRHSVQDLFRSEKKHNQIKISCAALNTKLRNGLAETQHGVAVQTNAINVRLAGKLDLGREKLRLALTTVPVRGLKLSLTGNVVNSIELSGNLAEPDISINGAAVAGKVVSATGLGLLLAPLTGGLGLVAGAGVGLLAGDLLENWLADDDPCETAMRRGAPKQRDDPEWLNMPIDDLVDEIFQNKPRTENVTEDKDA